MTFLFAFCFCKIGVASLVTQQHGLMDVVKKLPAEKRVWAIGKTLSKEGNQLLEIKFFQDSQSWESHKKGAVSSLKRIQNR